MSEPFSQWRVSLEQMTKTLPAEQVSMLIRKVTLEALRGIILRSPVGNPSLWKSKAPKGYVGGHFRNNWFIDINDIKPSERKAISKSGADSLSQMSKISNLGDNPYVVVYIHNSLPYARRLEYGWSTQAPHGMVNVTAQSISAIFR
jgi:hypothetical protein